MKLPLLLIAVTPTNNATRFLLAEVEKFVRNILILWKNLYTYPRVQCSSSNMLYVIKYRYSA